MEILAAAQGEGEEKERNVIVSELEVEENREPQPEVEVFDYMCGGWTAAKCQCISRSSGVKTQSRHMLSPLYIQHQFPLCSRTAPGRQLKESLLVTLIFQQTLYIKVLGLFKKACQNQAAEN